MSKIKVGQIWDRIEELLEQEGFAVFKQKNNKNVKKVTLHGLTYRIN